MLSAMRKLLRTNFQSLSACASARLLSTSDTEYYDVIISGGGLVGGAMALALGSSAYFKDKKLLLLEAAPAPDTVPFDHSRPYSNRVCAISPGSKLLMEELQVWDKIERKCPVRKMQVWDARSNSMITFDKDDMQTNLCYIIENNLMISSIQERLREIGNENLHTKYHSRIKTCSLPRNYAREDVNEPLSNAKVTLVDGQEIESELLIAADGARSLIAEQTKIPKVSWEYGEMAIVATLKLSEATENFVAWQRFLPTGPIAMLPLDDEHSSLVWSTTSEHAEDLIAMDDKDFVAEVNNAFVKEYNKHIQVAWAENYFDGLIKSWNGDDSIDSMQLPPEIVSIDGKKASFPLGVSLANKYVKPRLALIGDSAHRIHPLAGQGANLGFGDVSCLLNILDQAVYEGKDIGDLSHLMDYEKERQARNFAIAGVTDTLNKLYSTSFMPIVLLRSLGLKGTNASNELKNFIINQAMK